MCCRDYQTSSLTIVGCCHSSTSFVIADRKLVDAWTDMQMDAADLINLQPGVKSAAKTLIVPLQACPAYSMVPEPLQLPHTYLHFEAVGKLSACGSV